MTRSAQTLTLTELLDAHGGGPLPTALLEAHHPADIAAALTELPVERAQALLRQTPPATRAALFGYLPEGLQTELMERSRRAELAELFAHMAHDERVDLFNRLPPDRAERLLPALAHAEREDLRKLASYAEGTVGAVMTSDYATLKPELTAREAVEHLRTQAPDRETIYQAYVVDEERRLIGTVSLRELIVAPPNALVRDLMLEDVIFARVEEEREEAAAKIAKYDLIALPVVNGGHRLVGIVTYDDAMDVLEEEVTEDFQKVGTVSKLVTNVREAGVWTMYRARIAWLVVLVFGNIFSGAGIAYFEETIAMYVALVFFLPLLIGSGGNAGSQASTMMIRALATGDVRLGDWGRMIGREILVAGALGLTLAAAVLLIGLARGGPEIATIVATAMVLIVLVGSTIGMSLPFALSRLKLDPATASAPLVTSIADVTGVVIYFSIASALLPT